MKLHPDRNMNKADAAEAFRKVSEAYQVLSSPESRQEYDCKVLGTRWHVTLSVEDMISVVYKSFDCYFEKLENFCSYNFI